MRTIRITDNGFEITNVRATMKNSIWMNLKDKTKHILQKMGSWLSLILLAMSNASKLPQ